MLKQFAKSDLVTEEYGGEPYEYYPLGEHIVMAPGVCGGRPTFKYTRLEASVILADLGLGYTIDEILYEFQRSKISREAIQEVIHLAQDAFILQSSENLPLAVA